MILDPEKHEADKMKFLLALHAIAKEYMAEHAGVGDPVDVYEEEDVIAQRAGLTEKEGHRISEELIYGGLVESRGGGVRAAEFNLTRDGLNVVERHLYERTLLAKRRKLQAGAKGLLGMMFASTVSKLVSLAGAFLAGVIFSRLFPAIWRAIKETLGLP